MIHLEIIYCDLVLPDCGGNSANQNEGKRKGTLVNSRSQGCTVLSPMRGGIGNLWRPPWDVSFDKLRAGLGYSYFAPCGAVFHAVVGRFVHWPVEIRARSPSPFSSGQALASLEKTRGFSMTMLGGIGESAGSQDNGSLKLITAFPLHARGHRETLPT